MKHTLLMAASCGVISICTAAQAAENHDHHNHANHSAHGMSVAGGHDHNTALSAPIGIMGDHMHSEGDWMVSYRFNRMSMKGMRDGTNDLSPTDVIAISNPNAPPANYRVVPTEMTMDMHMVGAMYGVTDWLTLMGMGMIMDNSMNHVTFSMAGAQLGTFTTESSGWGDTSLSGLVRLYEDDIHHLHLNVGLSLPTGSTDETAEVLTPMNTRSTLRLPYMMQLGSGTYDALPGVTYTGQDGAWGWGLQYRAEIRLEDENDEGYALGDEHSLNAWGVRKINPWLEGNARLSYLARGDIDGADPLIAAPVPTADPDNYGADIVEIGLGFNITPKGAQWEGLRFGGEVNIPVYQDLNGPQMKRDISGTVGLTYSF